MNSSQKSERKRVWSDWNTIKSGGAVRGYVSPGEEVPALDELVWSCDSGERVLATVAEMSNSKKEGWHIVQLLPDWSTQEDDDAI